MPEPSELTYGQVADLHRTLGKSNPQLAELPLQDFAALANQVSGSGEYSAGLNDNWVKRTSHTIDRMFAPVGKPIGAFAESVTRELGYEKYADLANELGTGLPRGALETAAMFTPAGWVGKGLTAAGLASNYANTYTATDSKLAGAASAASLGLLPPMIRAGEKLAMAPLKRGFWETVSGMPGGAPAVKSVLLPVAERSAEFAGRNVGALLNQELAIQSTTLAATGRPAPFDDRHYAELVAGQLPFTLLEAAGVVRPRFRGEAGSNARARANIELHGAVREATRAAETANDAMQMDVASTSKRVESVLNEIADPKQRATAATDANKMYQRVMSEVMIAGTEGRPLNMERINAGATDSTRRMVSVIMDDMLGRPEGERFLTRAEDGTISAVAGFNVEEVLARRGGRESAKVRITPEGGRELPPLDSLWLGAGATARKGSMLETLMGVDVQSLEHPARVVEVLLGPEAVQKQQRAFQEYFRADVAEPKRVAVYGEGAAPKPTPAMTLDSVTDYGTAKQYILERFSALAKGRKTDELVEARHMLYGDGVYARESLGKVTTKSFAGAAKDSAQVFIGGKPTEMVQYQAPRTDGSYYTAFREATPGELKAFEKPTLTKAKAAEASQKAQASFVQKENALRQTFAEERQAAMDKVGVGSLEELAQKAADSHSQVEYDLTGFSRQISPAERKAGAVEGLVSLLPEGEQRTRLERMLTRGEGDPNSVRLTTADELALLQVEAEQLRVQVTQHAPEDVRKLLHLADGEYAQRFTELATTIERDGGYSGGVAAERYAALLARRVRDLQSLLGLTEGAYAKHLEARWEVEEGTAVREAQERRSKLSKLVGEDRKAETEGVTADTEAVLFEKMRVLSEDPELTGAFEGLTDMLYRFEVTRSGRTGPLADVVSRYGLYKMFDHAVDLMEGYKDVKAGRATDNSKRWLDAAKGVGERKELYSSPRDPREVLLSGLRKKESRFRQKGEGSEYETTPLDRAASFMEMLDDEQRALLQEGSTEFRVDDDLELQRQMKVEQFLDEDEVRRMGERLSGTVREIEAGTIADQVRTDVVETLKVLQFKKGKLKNLTLAKIIINPVTGEINYQKSGKVGLVERERKTTSGMELANVLENTRDIIVSAKEWGVEIRYDGNGEIVIGVDGQRHSQRVLDVKERVLRHTGSYTEQATAEANAYRGNVTEKMLKDFPEAKVGDDVQDATRAALVKRFPEASVATIDGMAQEAFNAARLRYANTLHSLFSVWATGKKGQPSPVKRVLQAAMGEVWDTMVTPTRDFATARVTKTLWRRHASLDKKLRTADEVIFEKRSGYETPDAFDATTHFYFKSEFMKLGLPEGEALLFAESAVRIARTFDNITNATKLGPTFRSGALGEAVNFPGATAAIMLTMSNSRFYNSLPHLAQKQFLMMQVFAHEITHILTRRSQYGELEGVQQAAMDVFVRKVTGLYAGERGTIVRDLIEANVPEQYRGELMGYVEARTSDARVNPAEFVSDYVAFRVLGMVRPAESGLRREGVRFVHGPDYLAQFDRALFSTMDDFVRVYKATDRLGADVEFLDKTISGALKDQKLIDDVGKRMSALAEERPSEYGALVGQGALGMGVDEATRFLNVDYGAAAVEYASVAMGRGAKETVERHFGVSPGWIERTFALPAHLAKRYPVLRPAIDAVFRFRPMANEKAHYMALPMLKEHKIFGLIPAGAKLDVATTGIQFLTKNQKAHDAAVHIALAKQGTVNADGTPGQPGKVMSDVEMREIATRYGVTKPEHQQRIIDFHRNVEKVAPRMREMLLASMREIGAIAVARRLMLTDKSMSSKVAKATGKRIFELVRAAAYGDQNALVALQAETIGGKVMEHSMEFINKLKAFEERTEGADWFMSEIRLGENMVVWRDRAQKKHGSAGFETEGELVAKLQQLERDPNVSNIRAWRKHDRSQQYSGLNPDFITHIKSIEDAALLKEQIQAGWGGDEIGQFNYTPLEATLKQVEDKSAERYMKERKLAPGREDVDMVKGFLTHITSMANGLAKEITKGEVQLALSDPSIRGSDINLNLARDHFNTVLNPSAREFSSLKKLNFAYFMGMNISSMLIEPTQALIALWPMLTRDTGKVGAGLSSLGVAMRMLGTAATGKGKGLVERIANVDPAMSRGLQKAVREQTIDFGVMQEFYSATDDALLNLRGLMRGGTVGEKVGRGAKAALNSYVDVTRTIYSQVPKLNNLIAYMSAFDAARRHGVLQNGKVVKMTEAGAHEYATDTTRATMYGGGAAAKPIGMFARAGKFQGVMGLGYSLGTYTFGILSHFAKLGAESIDRRKLLTPVERKAAQKALGQTIATQVALAGGLGLPGTGAALAVLEDIFPGLQARKAVEDGLRDLFNEDEESGGLLTDFALRGAPYSFAGVDMSSRLAISQVMGVSPYDGFRLANVMGPTGSVVENIVKATGQASQGLVGDAAETIMPTAYKNVVKLWRDGWEVKDNAGRKLLEPTPGELMLDAIGFRPARLTKLRDAQRQMQRGDEIAANAQSRFYREMGEQLLAGDSEGVRDALLARQSKVEGFSAAAGARYVADAALNLLLPYDPARTGTTSNASDRQRLALRGGFQRVSEMERLQTKKRLEAQIGFPGARPSNTQVRSTMLMDQLMDSNPFMSRQEASAIAEGRPF